MKLKSNLDKHIIEDDSLEKYEFTNILEEHYQKKKKN